MKAILLLAVFCLALCVVNAQPGRFKVSDWRKLNVNGAGPGIRDAMSVQTFDDDIYFFGGIYESLNPQAFFPNVFYNDMWKFDVQSRTWIQKFPNPDPVHGFPTPRAHALSGRNGKDFIIAFGINYTNDFSTVNTFNDIWAYNTQTNRWRMIRGNSEDADVPARRGEPTGTVYNGKIFLFGGVDGGFSTLGDFWIYDIATDVWTQQTNAVLPSARQGTDAVLDRDFGRLWMYAGERGEFSEETGFNIVFAGPDAFWFLDLESYEWTQVHPSPNMPDRSSGNSAAWIAGKFFLFGGDIQHGNDCDNFITNQNNVNETWAYSSHSNEFNHLCPDTIPPNLKRAKMTTVANTVYMFGGFAFDSRVCSPIVFNTDIWAFTVTGAEGGPECPN